MTDANPKASANPIEALIGERLRDYRTARGLSQDQLADKCGLNRQRLAAYEDALERISASDLFEIAGVLRVDVCWFFKGTPLANNDNFTIDPPHLFHPDTWKMAFEFDAISDQETRRKVLDLLTSIAKN